MTIRLLELQGTLYMFNQTMASTKDSSQTDTKLNLELMNLKLVTKLDKIL